MFCSEHSDWNPKKGYNGFANKRVPDDNDPTRTQNLTPLLEIKNRTLLLLTHPVVDSPWCNYILAGQGLGLELDGVHTVGHRVHTLPQPVRLTHLRLHNSFLVIFIISLDILEFANSVWNQICIIGGLMDPDLPNGSGSSKWIRIFHKDPDLPS